MRTGLPLLRRPGREAALQATERLVAAHYLVSYLERLLDERDRRPGGLTSTPPPGLADRWSPPGPVSAALARPGLARAVDVVGLGAAGSLLAPGSSASRAAASALLTVIGVGAAPVHRLGSDGADRVALLVSAVAAVARAAQRDRGVVDACLWFLAVTGVHGYAVAGWAKLLSPAWRDEGALLRMLATGTHGHRGAYAAADRHRTATRWVSRAVAVLEASAPVVLAGPGRRLAWPFVGAATCFHLSSAHLMGLNRFPAAFAASYPGLLYATGPRHSAGSTGNRDDLMVPALLAVGLLWAVGVPFTDRRARRRVALGRAGDTRAASTAGRPMRLRWAGKDHHGLPLVVLVHGAGESVEHWDRVVDRLAGRWRVLAHDRAGATTAETVAELAELLQAHAAGRRAVLVGRSTGAHLAWCAAARTNLPLHALVLIDAVHPGDLRAATPDHSGRRATSPLQGSAGWVRCGFGPLVSRPVWLHEVPPHLRRLVLDQQRHPAVWAAAAREVHTLTSAPGPTALPAAVRVVTVRGGPSRHGPMQLWQPEDAEAVVAVLDGLLRSDGAVR